MSPMVGREVKLHDRLRGASLRLVRHLLLLELHGRKSHLAASVAAVGLRLQERRAVRCLAADLAPRSREPFADSSELSDLSRYRA